MNTAKFQLPLSQVATYGACLIAWLNFLVPARSAEAGKTNAPSPLLTVSRIYEGSEFGGDSFSGTWLDDGNGYTTLEAAASGAGGRDIVRHDAKTGAKEILVTSAELTPRGESTPLAVEDIAWSKDRSRVLIYTNSKRVWRTNSRGDYWVLDRTSRELTKLGGDARPSSLMFAKFSPDASRVAYVRDQNIYLEDLSTRRITPLTSQSSPDIINGTFDWVYEEEFALRDGFRWSPDGRFIAYWQLNTEGVSEVSLVNNTDALYPTIQRIKYPKTGEQNAACRIGVVELSSGTTRWIATPGDPRNTYLFDLQWPEGAAQPILQQLNRLQNTNRIFLADPITGGVQPVLTDRDDAWVDAHQDLKWFRKGSRFLFPSERDGWRHLYSVRPADGRIRQVTQGSFDVTQLSHVDEKEGWVYFIASPQNPTQRYLYRCRLNGRSLERVTPADQTGTHAYQISPNGRWAVHTRSTFLQPPVTELVSLPDHKTVRVLSENKKLQEAVSNLTQVSVQFLRVPITNGVELDAWMIQPPEFDPNKKYPLLIHVYGEPAGSTVKDAWGGKGLLWHWMLAQQGYVVMSLDNRGTDTPRGRAWRKSIYRQVGSLASQDQAEALEHLLKTQPSLDASRVGIWGWSGGGSMTLNALLRYPNLYRAGISIAPVPNMRLYDTIYQERYMGLPSDNADGYRKGSPLTFASQLKGNLLIIHGTGDDNCHYQGFEALINEFIRYNKPFQMMAYPNRSHSISEGSNTTLHLRQLMTTFLNEKLPPGPR